MLLGLGLRLPLYVCVGGLVLEGFQFLSYWLVLVEHSLGGFVFCGSVVVSGLHWVVLHSRWAVALLYEIVYVQIAGGGFDRCLLNF